jgi:chromosome segregation ATPase
LSRLGVAIGDSSMAEQGALAAFVDSADRHHRHAENQEDLSPMARIASSAYAILAEIAHGAEAWPALQQCSVHLEAQWQQCGATIEAVAEMAHRFSVNETAARVEAAHLASDLSAQIRWSEEAVEIRAALQANHDELLKRAEALTLDHQRLSADLERESEEAGRLRRELSLAEARAAQADVEASRFQGEAVRAGVELSLASARAAQAEGEASRFQGEAERAGVELSLLAARFAKADSDLAVARDQLTQLGQDLSRSEKRAAQMQSELAMAHAEATRLGEQLSLSQAEASAHAARIEQMLHSRSWKVTRPLRALGAVLLPRARR